MVVLQSDTTLLYDQLERINNRLKQRASRAARSEDSSNDSSETEEGPTENSSVISTAGAQIPRIFPTGEAEAPTRHLSKEELRANARKRGLA